MKPSKYPLYKRTSIPSLGEIPSHWEIIHGKGAFIPKKDSNIGLKESQVLSLSYGKIRIRKQDELHGLIPESFETYQIVEPGDIICRPTDLQNDWNSLRFGLSSHKGIITSAYLCFQTPPSMDNRYGHLLLHTYDLQKVFYGLGSGLRQNLDWKDFKYLTCLRPPVKEQAAIVQYLDEADQQIQAYISAKEKLIALLEEQRQAVIHQVVTRGLDPNVRLKPSGVEWLGHVPEHWEVKPLKQWVTINEAVLPETTGPDFHFRYLEIGAVTAGEILEEPKKIKFADAPSRARRIVKSSDTIVSTVRTYLKAIWFAERLEEPLICSTGFAVITPREGTVPRFVSYIIQDNNFTDRITAESTGTGYPAISESRLAALKVCVPSASEQAQIIQQLDGVTTSLNESIKHARSQIELMREYRTRLIADVVTGKLDVRKAAEKLS